MRHYDNLVFHRLTCQNGKEFVERNVPKPTFPRLVITCENNGYWSKNIDDFKCLGKCLNNNLYFIK